MRTQISNSITKGAVKIKNEICSVCNTQFNNKVPGGIKFEWLEDEPYVCEKCMYKALTNIDIKYDNKKIGKLKGDKNGS